MNRTHELVSEGGSQMIFLKCMVYQLSPSANMNVRDGRITFQDVFLSYENRDKVVNMTSSGSAQVYDLMDARRKDQPDCEFDIYPFASNPQLVERHTDPFATFIESMDFGS